jgi:hypothetical protein
MSSQPGAPVPPALAPAAIMVGRRRLDGWDARPAALLDELRPRLAASELRRIAGGNHGLDVDRHLAALVAIQATGLIPQPLAWHPRETLELERWRNDDHTDHVARAFACAVLLIDAGGATPRDGHEQTMPVLIESCAALGDAALAGAAGLLVALVEAFDEQWQELPFAYLGLLVAAAARDPRDPRLPSLCARLIDAAATASGYGADVPRPGWLLDQTRFDAKHRLWRRLVARYLAAPAGHDASLTHLAAIAIRIQDVAE